MHFLAYISISMISPSIRLKYKLPADSDIERLFALETPIQCISLWCTEFYICASPLIEVSDIRVVVAFFRDENIAQRMSLYYLYILAARFRKVCRGSPSELIVYQRHSWRRNVANAWKSHPNDGIHPLSSRASSSFHQHSKLMHVNFTNFVGPARLAWINPPS